MLLELYRFELAQSISVKFVFVFKFLYDCDVAAFHLLQCILLWNHQSPYLLCKHDEGLQLIFSQILENINPRQLLSREELVIPLSSLLTIEWLLYHRCLEHRCVDFMPANVHLTVGPDYHLLNLIQLFHKLIGGCQVFVLGSNTAKLAFLEF